MDFTANTEWFYNSAGQWLISASILIGSVVVVRLMHWFLTTQARKFTRKTRSNIDDLLIETMEDPILMGVMVAFVYWGFERLTFPKHIELWLDKLFHVLMVINLTWFLARLSDALIRKHVIPKTTGGTTGLDRHLVPVIRRGAKMTIWVLGLIIALDNAGYDVGALVAGLGVGGVAMALAAKDFVANIFGGLTVYADKPFKIGDRIIADGYDGTVTDIGLRSTKLKTTSGRMVTVPNYKFTESSVENISAEPDRKVELLLHLSRETNENEIKLVDQILSQVVSDKSNYLTDECVVVFTTWPLTGPVISWEYHIRPNQDNNSIKHAVHTEALGQLQKAGIRMADPLV